jgi:hypothetical protein
MGSTICERGHERAEAVGVERPRRERDAVELRLGGLDEHGVRVTEVDRRVRGEAVEVAAPVDVGDPGPVTRFHHDLKGVIVVRSVLVDEPDGGRLRD